VLARSCGRYERAEDVYGLFGAVVAVICAAMLLPYGEGALQVLYVVAIGLACVIGGLVGVGLAAMLPGIKRLWISRARRRAAIVSKGSELFTQRKVHQTTSGTGVVVLASLFERVGCVVCDQAVRDHLDESVLARCDELLDGCGDPQAVADAMAEVLQLLGETLGEVMPRYRSETNELPDALVVLE